MLQIINADVYDEDMNHSSILNKSLHKLIYKIPFERIYILAYILDHTRPRIYKFFNLSKLDFYTKKFLLFSYNHY